MSLFERAKAQAQSAADLVEATRVGVTHNPTQVEVRDLAELVRDLTEQVDGADSGAPILMARLKKLEERVVSLEERQRWVIGGADLTSAVLARHRERLSRLESNPLIRLAGWLGRAR